MPAARAAECAHKKLDRPSREPFDKECSGTLEQAHRKIDLKIRDYQTREHSAKNKSLYPLWI